MATIKITLYRYMTSDQGTLGLWVMPSGKVYDTLELPWRDNAPNRSCVPAGTYEVILVTARRSIGGRRDLYLLLKVPGRSSILVHAGTFAGDKLKGYKSTVLGCILAGKAIGTLKGQLAIFNTRTAVAEIIKTLAGKPFTLTIEEMY